MHRPLRLLHLSDIHFRKKKDWDSRSVLRQLAEVAAQMVEKDQKPDVAVLTGDIAFSGIAEEYELAEQWLTQKLMPALKLGPERILIVPGNHDIDRKKISRATELIRNDLLNQKSQQAIQEAWNGQDVGLLQQPQQAYLNFLSQFKSQQQVHSWWSYKLEHEGKTVGFAGLDSAWMSAGDRDHGQLLLGQFQLNQVLEPLCDCAYTIALMHHPKSYLNSLDGERSWSRMRQDCHLILRGHQHQQGLEIVTDASSHSLELAAGASYEDSNYANSFQLLEIDLDSGQLTIYPYHWYQGTWQRERNFFSKDPGGVGRIQLNAAPQAKRTPRAAGQDQNETKTNMGTIGAQIMPVPQNLDHRSEKAGVNASDAVPRNKGGPVDKREFVTHDPQSRYSQCIQALKNFEDEHKSDLESWQVAQTEYQGWKDDLLKLMSTIEDNLLYEFTEILENPEYRLTTFKKMMILPLTQNEAKNATNLEKYLKDVNEGLPYLDHVRFSEALTGLENIHVRRSGVGDYNLNDTLFQEQELTQNARTFLKISLETLLIVYRQLHGKSLKEIIKLMIWISQSDHHFQEPLKRPSFEAIFEYVCSENPVPSPFDTDTIASMTRSNYQRAQKAQTLAEQLQRDYFDYLNKNLIRALNALKQARANYHETVTKRFRDPEAELKLWGGIFDALIKLLSDYLEKHLHIEIIPCKRGDTYDPEQAIPTDRAEPDDALSRDQIKAVDEDGYRYNHKGKQWVVTPTRVTVVG